MEDDDYTFIAPVDPDPIKLDESGEVVVVHTNYYTCVLEPLL